MWLMRNVMFFFLVCLFLWIIFGHFVSLTLLKFCEMCLGISVTSFILLFSRWYSLIWRLLFWFWHFFLCLSCFFLLILCFICSGMLIKWKLDILDWFYIFFIFLIFLIIMHFFLYLYITLAFYSSFLVKIYLGCQIIIFRVLFLPHYSILSFFFVIKCFLILTILIKNSLD